MDSGQGQTQAQARISGGCQEAQSSSGAELSPAAGSLAVRLAAGLVGGPGQKVLRLGRKWLEAWNPGPLLPGVTEAMAMT